MKHEAPELLDPELVPCITHHSSGIVTVAHPLVFGLYSEAQHRQFNEQLRFRKQRLPELIKERAWMEAVLLYQRPYRLKALLNFLPVDDIPGEEFWELVGFVYTDSESVRDDYSAWDDLLRSASNDHLAFMMSTEDKLELAAIQASPTATLYQGHTADRDDGWSWTTSLDTARWFADRFAFLEDSSPRLSTVSVDTRNIHVFFGGRDESEVLINPDFVSGRTIETIRCS